MLQYEIFTRPCPGASFYEDPEHPILEVFIESWLDGTNTVIVKFRKVHEFDCVSFGFNAATTDVYLNHVHIGTLHGFWPMQFLQLAELLISTEKETDFHEH